MNEPGQADTWSSTITAVGSFLGAVSWPALLLIVTLVFRRPLSALIGNIQQATLKTPGGIEASITSRVEESVVAASVTKSSTGTGSDVPAIVREAKVLAARVAGSPSPSGKRVLWVDDRPENNRWEREALLSLGVGIVESRSTADALQSLRNNRFDLVITDMGRPEGKKAGLDLLDSIRAARWTVPVIFYTGSEMSDAVDEAKRHGAAGYTSRPARLIELAVDTLSPAN